VRFLDLLYTAALSPPRLLPGKRIAVVDFTRDEFYKIYYASGLSFAPDLTFVDPENDGMVLDADFNAFELMIEIIMRSQLMKDSTLPASSGAEDMGTNTLRPPETTYGFTQVGVAFLRACRPPKNQDQACYRQK
jgi:hypothetical protein